MTGPIVEFRLQRVENRPDRFNYYPIGNGMVASIQAGHANYCHPRITDPSSDAYTEFEVALFFLNEWYHPHTNEKLCDRKWASHWSPNDQVGAYVPRVEVINMINDLRDYFKVTHAGKETDT